jgi:hypothetical protein
MVSLLECVLSRTRMENGTPSHSFRKPRLVLSVTVRSTTKNTRSLSQWRAKLQVNGQARWAEMLSQFCFTIMDRSEEQNIMADTLSPRVGCVGPQDEVQTQHHTRALLQSAQIRRLSPGRTRSPQ